MLMSEKGGRKGIATKGKLSGGTHVGTAGVILDFSFAAGLEPIRSSFSRRVFSDEMILRVAIFEV